MRRVVVIHCHMFKNAGTTLDWVLERNFGKQFVDHRDNEAMRTGAPYLRRYIERYPDLKALSSHHVRLPLPTVPGTVLLPVFLLRHPLDRVESVYRFERQQRASTPGAKYAKKHSFKEYVAWRLDGSVGATIRNFQVRNCAGWHKRDEPGPNEMDMALENLERSPLVGVVERFDESIVLMGRELEGYFGTFDTAYMVQNSGSRVGTSLTDRIQRIERSLTKPLMEALVRHNELDLRLYLAAMRLLDERIRSVNDFDRRLDEHRTRCEQLATGTDTVLRG